MENKRLEFLFSMPPAAMGTNHRRRLHWTQINDLTDTWKQIHRRELREQCQTIPFFDYALVEIEQVVPNFRSVVDNDNLTGKSKTVLDAMTEEGLWKDDSPSHVEIAVRTRQQKGAEPYLRVFVSAIPRPEPLETLSNTGTKKASKSSRRVGATSSPRSTGGNSRKGSNWTLRKPSTSSERD